MKTNYVLLPLLFLLFAAGAFAAPIVSVDPTVQICNERCGPIVIDGQQFCDRTCSNSTTVKAGLEHIKPEFTTSLQYIKVLDTAPATKNGTLLIADTSQQGQLTLRITGVNTTAYRQAVEGALRTYYAAAHPAAPKHKYALPSWMPRPGQCDLGVRVQDSRGISVCVR